MQDNSGINANPMNLQALADSFRGRGIVKSMHVVSDDAGVNKQLFIRTGGRLQGLIGYLSGKKARAAYADQICSKFRQIFGSELTAELTHDVRSKIMKTGSLKGDFLAKKIEAFHQVYAANKGQKILTQIGSPMHVRSNCCIVGFASANSAIGERFRQGAANAADWFSATLLDAWGTRQGSFENDQSLSRELSFTSGSTRKLVSLRECDDPVSSQRKSADMYKLIYQAIGDSTGAIVIEPQPDGKEHGVPEYTFEGLKAQIQAVLDRQQEAAKAGLDRVISFVSPDRHLLARIGGIAQAMTGDAEPLEPGDSTN